MPSVKKSKSMKGGTADDITSHHGVAHPYNGATSHTMRQHPATHHAARPAAALTKYKGGKRSKKSKTKKSPMPAGMAYCIRCRTRVKVESSKTEDRKMKNGKTRKFLIMQGKCGHEIMNFTK